MNPVKNIHKSLYSDFIATSVFKLLIRNSSLLVVEIKEKEIFQSARTYCSRFLSSQVPATCMFTRHILHSIAQALDTSWLACGPITSNHFKQLYNIYGIKSMCSTQGDSQSIMLLNLPSRCTKLSYGESRKQKNLTYLGS